MSHRVTKKRKPIATLPPPVNVLLGPYITTDVDPHNLKLELYLNGQVRQSCNTGEMLFKIPQIIAFLSRAMTLLPGDIICTGTCAGTGALAPGDEVEVRLEKVGSLRNRCRREDR